jgi:hypothetical protein
LSALWIAVAEKLGAACFSAASLRRTMHACRANLARKPVG